MGVIPTSLGNFCNLTTLYLHTNQLSGSIPQELGMLSSLTYLALSTNNLIGTIPTSLGNLGNLTTLYLHTNQLSGSIPQILGMLSSLTNLELSANNLIGTIPASLGNINNLTTISLYEPTFRFHPSRIRNAKFFGLPWLISKQSHRFHPYFFWKLNQTHTFVIVHKYAKWFYFFEMNNLTHLKCFLYRTTNSLVICLKMCALVDCLRNSRQAIIILLVQYQNRWEIALAFSESDFKEINLLEI